MSKYIVTSGCSFSVPGTDSWEPETKNESYIPVGLWPYYLEVKLPNFIYKNYGLTGMGNLYISRSILMGCNQLLDNGIDSEDITVIVMWSGLNRIETISETNKHIYDDNQELIPTGILDYNKMYWVETFMSSLEHILMTQEFLKLRNINYLFMTYMNQFSCGDNSFDWKLGKDGNLIPPITIDKPTLFSEYKWFGWMENLFDWSKWWFYENDLIKYGGMIEWVAVNYPDECRRGERENLPGHPTPIVNKNFVDEVLIKNKNLILI